jgi:hypothetical protein
MPSVQGTPISITQLATLLAANPALVASISTQISLLALTLPGQPGPSGRSITQASQPAPGLLLLTFSDGTTFQVVLPQGQPGSIAGLPPATSQQVAPNTTIVGLAPDGVTPVTLSPQQIAAIPISVWGQQSTGTLTGNGTTGPYTLSQTPQSDANLSVYVNGLYTTGWTRSGNQLTLPAATSGTIGFSIVYPIAAPNANTLATNSSGVGPVIAFTDEYGSVGAEINSDNSMSMYSVRVGNRLNSNGALPFVNSNGGTLFALSASVDPTKYALILLDQSGGSPFFVGVDGTTYIANASIENVEALRLSGSLSVGTALFENGIFPLAVQDSVGGVPFYVDNAGITNIAAANIGDITGPISAFSLITHLTQCQALADSFSRGVITNTRTDCARAVWNFNHVLSYGQSLSIGYEGFPAQTTTDDRLVGSGQRRDAADYRWPRKLCLDPAGWFCRSQSHGGHGRQQPRDRHYAAHYPATERLADRQHAVCLGVLDGQSDRKPVGCHSSVAVRLSAAAAGREHARLCRRWLRGVCL